MRLYLVAPVIAANTDRPATHARLRTCSESIADLILSHVSMDPALFAMRHVGEGSAPPVSGDTRYGEAETVPIADQETLRTILRACGDPSSGQWLLIRSLVTCRAILYGQDGQAFVCLPTGAPPILSPDDGMIRVEECSHLLIETDWLDGVLLD